MLLEYLLDKAKSFERSNVFLLQLRHHDRTVVNLPLPLAGQALGARNHCIYTKADKSGTPIGTLGRRQRERTTTGGR